MECPQLTQPPRTLGSADKLAVHVGKGQSSFRIDLHLTDNQLEGTIQFHQPSVDLKAEVSDQLGGKQVADRIAMVTSAIQDVHAVVRLEGTLREPRWKLESNLGTQLAAGLRTALSQEVQHRQQQLLAKVNQEMDRQLLRVRNEIGAKQRELLSELDLDSEELRFVRDELTKLNLPAKLVGENGLLRDLFRR